MKNANTAIATYIKNFANFEVLSADKTVELFEAYKNGDETARTTLINHNMKLVVKIASSFKEYDVDFSDLISVGAIGLMEAIENWNPDKSKLQSYAGVWIAKKMRELCDKMHVVHTKAWYRLNDDEKATCVQGASIDEKREDSEDGLTLGDSLADERQNQAEEYEKQDLFESALVAIQTRLNQTEQAVILHHHGLKAHKQMTLPQIAQMFGKTYQWAQQCEAKALEKIREYLAE